MSGALMQLVSRFTNVVTRENFDDVTNASASTVLLLLINLTIAIVIVCWVGQWLFNSVLVNVIPSVNRVTFLQFLGLYVLTHLLFC